jgi:hypothetical protein
MPSKPSLQAWRKMVAVALNVLVPSQAGSRLDQQGPQCRLADIERLTPEVITAELDQVEGVEEDASIMLPIADALEARPSVIIAAHCLTVDDARWVRSLFTFKLIARLSGKGPERELNHAFSLPEHNLYPFPLALYGAGRWWQPGRCS